MTDFNQLFRLERAGDYFSSTCQNEEDCLPLVYGVSFGPWKMPLIDVTNHVYCVAGHPISSGGGSGDPITVYVNGEQSSSGNWTCNVNNSSYSNCATVTFTSNIPGPSDLVTVIGNGKDDNGDGTGSIFDNPIDVIDDFLTNEAGLSFTWHETAKVRARAVCDDQGYGIGGTLCADINIWSLLQAMVGQFLGSVFIDINGYLVVDFETNDLPASQVEIISKSDIRFVSAEQRLADVINSLTCRWYPNHVTGEWENTALEEKSESVAVYGTRSAIFDFPWENGGHNTVRDLILAKFAAPLWRVTFRDLSLKRLGKVDVGDYVAATFERLYGSDNNPMINQIFKVLGVRPDLGKGYIEFDVLDTGQYMESAGARDTTVY